MTDNGDNDDQSGHYQIEVKNLIFDRKKLKFEMNPQRFSVKIKPKIVLEKWKKIREKPIYETKITFFLS